MFGLTPSGSAFTKISLRTMHNIFHIVMRLVLLGFIILPSAAFSQGTNAKRSSIGNRTFPYLEVIKRAKAERRIATLRSRLEEHPRDPDALRAIAWIHLGSGSPAASLPFFDQLIERQTDFHEPEDYVARAVARLQVGEVSKAEADLFLAHFHSIMQETRDDAYSRPARRTDFKVTKSDWVNEFPQGNPWWAVHDLLEKRLNAVAPGMRDPSTVMLALLVTKVEPTYYANRRKQIAPADFAQELASQRERNVYARGCLEAILNPYSTSSDTMYTGDSWTSSRRYFPSNLFSTGKGRDKVNTGTVDYLNLLRREPLAGEATFQSIVRYFRNVEDYGSVLTLLSESAEDLHSQVVMWMKYYLRYCNESRASDPRYHIPDYSRARTTGMDTSEKAEKDRLFLMRIVSDAEKLCAMQPNNEVYRQFLSYARSNQLIQKSAHQAYIRETDVGGMALAAILFGAAAGLGDAWIEDWNEQQKAMGYIHSP